MKNSYKSIFSWCFVLVFSLNYLLFLNQYSIYEEWVKIIYFSEMNLEYFCEFL